MGDRSEEETHEEGKTSASLRLHIREGSQQRTTPTQRSELFLAETKREKRKKLHIRQKEQVIHYLPGEKIKGGQPEKKDSKRRPFRPEKYHKKNNKNSILHGQVLEK